MEEIIQGQSVYTASDLLEKHRQRGAKDVAGLLEQLLYQGTRKPRVALLFIDMLPSDKSMESDLKAASASFTFTMSGMTVSHLKDLSRKLRQMDASGVDAVCLVAQKPLGTMGQEEALDLCKTIFEMTTPCISAMADMDAEGLLPQIVDKAFESPAALAEYFKTMALRVKEELAASKTAWVQKVTEPFAHKIVDLEDQKILLTAQIEELFQELKQLRERLAKAEEEKQSLVLQLSKQRRKKIIARVAAIALGTLSVCLSMVIIIKNYIVINL